MSEPGYTATSESTIVDALRRVVAARGDEVALRIASGGPGYTWNQCAERVAAIADGLAVRGAGPGDPVAQLLTNRPEFHFVDTAVQHLGAAPFSCCNSSSPEQLGYLIRASGARVAVTERLLAPAIAGQLAEPASPLRLLVVVEDGEDGGGSSKPPAEVGDGEDGGGSSKPPAEVGDGEDGGGSSAPPLEEPGKTGDGEDGGGSSARPAGEPGKTGDGEDGGGSSAPPAEGPGKTGDGEDGGGSSAPPAEGPGKTGDGEDGGGSSVPPKAERIHALHRPEGG